jgi:hypothetical protein
MVEIEKRIFIGVKISRNLEKELDNPAPGTEGYLRPDNVNCLQIVRWGEDKLIGRYLSGGFPVVEINNVSREISDILKLVIPGHRVHENSVHIYVLEDT